MALFEDGEPIILKESNSARSQLAALESLRGSLPASVERSLEEDIRALKAGIAGEERILFELRNSHMDMCVIQDLRLEYDGLRAQIDFLVITRQRNFVIECKNLYGNIVVDGAGNFIRTFGGRKREGIYSPVTQNRRHLDLIRAMKRADRSTFMNILVDRDFDDVYRSLIVLANPKTVVDARNAPEEVQQCIVRADQLIAAIKAINNERGAGRDKTVKSVVRKLGEWFLERDSAPSDVDYTKRYREMAGNNDDMNSGHVTAAAVIGQPLRPAQNAASAVPACPKCGAPMVLRIARRGEHAGKQFYGCSAYPKCKGVIGIVS